MVIDMQKGSFTSKTPRFDSIGVVKRILAETHQKNISKYEQDMVVPSALTLKAIADALAVTTDYLLGSDLEDTIKDKALLEQFKLVDTLEQADKEALMRVVSAYIRDTKTKQAYQ